MGKKKIVVISVGTVLILAAALFIGLRVQNSLAIRETIREGEICSIETTSFPTKTGRITDLSNAEIQAAYDDKVAELKQYYSGKTLSLKTYQCKVFYLDGYNSGSALDYTYAAGMNNIKIYDIRINYQGNTATVNAKYDIWSKSIEESLEGIYIRPRAALCTATYSLKKVEGHWKIEDTPGSLNKSEEGGDANAAIAKLSTSPVFYDTFNEAASAAEELDLAN